MKNGSTVEQTAGRSAAVLMNKLIFGGNEPEGKGLPIGVRGVGHPGLGWLGKRLA
jgi:hypothetical protein